jgi:hypothetical protein
VKVTNDQIDKLTESCLDISIRRYRSIDNMIAEFERQTGMPLSDVRTRMSFDEFDEAYQRFCRVWRPWCDLPEDV